jgi:hypothetical protein
MRPSDECRRRLVRAGDHHDLRELRLDLDNRVASHFEARPIEARFRIIELHLGEPFMALEVACG